MTLAISLSLISIEGHSGTQGPADWESVAVAIAPKHPFELASAIFATQAERETRFMAEYSGAKNVTF